MAISVVCCLLVHSQIPEPDETPFETMASEENAEIDDEILQQIQSFATRKLNLNYADEETLARLYFLSPNHIHHLIRYRELFGLLISIYELQAVPGWDIELIRKILPYITVEENKLLDHLKLFERWKHMNYDALLRVSAGSKTLFRFKESHKNLLQYGVTINRNSSLQSPVFVSAHLFAREVGMIKKLAFGDFAVSLGQGLILGQGFGTKKSANVLLIKRQTEILRPYTSSGNPNFFRGIASTVQYDQWQSTVFISKRMINPDNNNTQLALGGSFKRRITNGNISLNGVTYRYSNAIQKVDRPYNYFAFSGKKLSNFSISYDRTFRNVHWFGELAIDDLSNHASVNGLLLSLDRNLDLSIVHRSISPSYRSLYANSFTENTSPVNEKGFYVGASLRPGPRLQVDAFADVFEFPFIKYRIDMPSQGCELFCQVTYAVSKQLELSGRIKSKTTALIKKKQARFELEWSPASGWLVRQRIESLNSWPQNARSTQGCLSVSDVAFKPCFKSFDLKVRMIGFETDGADATIYVVEPEVLYSSSVPGFAGKGLHYQIFFNTKLKPFIHILKREKMTLKSSFSLSQTIYSQQSSLKQSGNEPAHKNISKLVCQVIAEW